jgi:hypothetical protein
VTQSPDAFVRAQRELANDWGFRCFEDALRSWIATVAIVEVEYVGEWEEYANELTARDYIDELARRCPGEAPRIEGHVALWDERFLAATVRQEKPWLRLRDGEAGWWMYRRPKRWRQPAREELRAAGYMILDCDGLPRKDR